MNERGRFARDVYTYSHLPIVAGIILSAAALEEITFHPKDELGEAFRWMLIAGLALNLGGVGIAVLRAYRVVAPERLTAVVVLVGLVLLAGEMTGLTLLVLIDLVLLVMLLVEHQRVERRYAHEHAEAPAATG
jgi:low temperature requirement protein LtrA